MSEQPHLRDQESSLPQIVRGRFGKLTIYEISDYELKILGQGSHDSLYLNFAIFLITTAISFLIALLTTTISSYQTYTFFIVVTVIGFIGSSFLFILWFRNRRSASKIVDTIQKRVPSDRSQDSAQRVRLFELSDGRYLQVTEETVPLDSLQHKSGQSGG